MKEQEEGDPLLSADPGAEGDFSSSPRCVSSTLKIIEVRERERESSIILKDVGMNYDF